MPERTAAPEFATHYYRASRRPFLNLSDLEDADAMSAMTKLIEERRAGIQRRPFGRRYLEMRKETERRLREAFVRMGGRPERVAPHYLVLGESRWFSGLADDMCELRFPLSELPPDQTTLTWTDSFSAMRVTRDFGLTYEPKPFHGRVYMLEEIPHLVEQFGLPSDQLGNYDGLASAEVETEFVEIQLWSDAPLAD